MIPAKTIYKPKTYRYRSTHSFWTCMCCHITLVSFAHSSVNTTTTVIVRFSYAHLCHTLTLVVRLINMYQTSITQQHVYRIYRVSGWVYVYLRNADSQYVSTVAISFQRTKLIIFFGASEITMCYDYIKLRTIGT